MNKLGKLSDRGHIFGLGAFRRYKEVTGHDLAHFETALLPPFELDDKRNIVYKDGEPVRIRPIDDVEANYRWATMLKCANDVHVEVHGGEKVSIATYEVLLSDADQKESNKLMDQYLDSNYMGKKMRDYYGIVEDNPSTDSKAKKKNTPRAKRSG